MMHATIKTAFSLVIIFFIFLYSTLPNIELLIENNPTTTAFIELRKKEAQMKQTPFSLKWEWVTLDELPPYLLFLVIESEDHLFWTHRGINLKNIKKAIVENWYAQRWKQGGSSISQQTAKNLYLSPSKTWIRKIRECFIAWQLEYHLTKERILEIYLNIAEWGDGVFGIRAAAAYWLDKSPADLTPDEALYLISMLPSPIKM